MDSKEIENLFSELRECRKQTKEFYQVNLQPLQIDFIKTKETLTAFNPEVIAHIEKWLTTFKRADLNNTEHLYGLDVENLSSANTIYTDYIATEEKYLELEKAIEKYSRQYKKYKEEETALQEKLIAIHLPLITEILDQYYSHIDYNRQKALEIGKKALFESYSTYKPIIPLSLIEYSSKLIKNYLTKYFKQEYNYIAIPTSATIPEQEYTFLLHKIISFIKTNMSIYCLHNFLKLNKLYYSDDILNKILADLKSIITIYQDNDHDKDINLVCHIYDLPCSEAEYIYTNHTSISVSLHKFIITNHL